MASPRITFYYDIGSPFSYIGLYVLKNSPVFSKCQIDYVPVLLRDLFQKCQNTPPLAVKNKLQWIQRERLYWSHRFGVPVTEAVPEGFPTSTIDIQTALCLIDEEVPEKLLEISARFYHVFWAEGDTKITTPERFLAVIENETTPEIRNHIKDKLASPDAKELPLNNTQRAFDSGAFGLPWFECANAEGSKEGFWGIDHLGRMADFLQLDTSLDRGFRVLM
ncbi:hypothetical protein N7478_004227 [Penicillium angulare]|uniref:uncharacterized protein n=1 Tax=Penicillium angulare TaxID=116970 RepID=UPI0025412C7D|nr:uncharacterized protein N7478_004227 [Penicillium angulare]KAJ5278855.1 hypothetical protein N7478_004227 [Penicillium angulare]